MKNRRVSSIINEIVRDWCLWVKYYARVDTEKGFGEKKKYCEKCELLNEKISRLVSEMDGIFNGGEALHAGDGKNQRI